MDTFIRNVNLNKFHNYFNLSYGDYVNNYHKYDSIVENIMHYSMNISALNNKLQLILNDWNKLFQNSEKSYKNINYCDYLNYWLYDKKSALKKLGTYKIYEDYNRRENTDDNCSYCDGVFMLEKYYLGINELCKMFARNLYETKDRRYRKGRCEYLYYWIYDKIWKMFNNNSGFIRDNDAVVKRLNAGYNISSKICINDCYTYYNPKINFGE
ncbi:PIR Superfamily Protein [Plasmodium ovale wallikeri]|uniref:PIR Superfamily Protein n=1 Tax=Plasmodium ovale wallikeri TaxID=864142 RepID=A0A1A9APH8_PLAOA|nr:PIR Superfamily Protein [Plasmodium ovale wallikeri]